MYDQSDITVFIRPKCKDSNLMEYESKFSVRDDLFASERSKINVYFTKDCSKVFVIVTNPCQRSLDSFLGRTEEKSFVPLWIKESTPTREGKVSEKRSSRMINT